MCNSGIYLDENSGKMVEGTPVRVARVISNIMRSQKYQKQQALLYFNDISEEKIAELKKHLPENTHNFHIETSVGDGNDLIRGIGKRIKSQNKLHYLLFYDPYQAIIDWDALAPFIRTWGEIIINHMLYDTIRGISQAKQPETASKYEQTYFAKLGDLLAFGNDRDAFEQRIHDIIKSIKGIGKKRYYIASFPFFNSKNVLIYNLLHCTSNIEGFKLYKSTAWSTFNDRSSNKNSKVDHGQCVFNFDENSDEPTITTVSENNCYCVHDIVKFIVSVFDGRENVPLDDIWGVVDEHPVFPSDLYKNDIKSILKQQGYKVHRSSIDFVK